MAAQDASRLDHARHEILPGDGTKHCLNGPLVGEPLIVFGTVVKWNVLTEEHKVIDCTCGLQR